MGYFATMMRQTGMRLGPAPRRPLPVVQRLEREDGRIAEVPARPTDSVAAVSALRLQNSHSERQPTQPEASGIRSLRTTEEQPLFTKPKPVAATSGSLTTILEYTVHTDAEITKIQIPPGQISPKPAADSANCEAIKSSPTARRADDPLPIPRELKHPSAAEILDWVAEPLKTLAQASAAPAPIVPPQTRESIELSREAYNLEIGTIEIVVDAPPQHQPTRPSPATRSEQSRTSSPNRMSRHYLRS